MALNTNNTTISKNTVMKNIIVVLLCVVTVVAFTTVISPDIAFATDATSPDYADKLLSNDGNGNGVIGWNEGIITELDGYDNSDSGKIGTVVDDLWELVTNLVTTVLAAVIFVFVIKISGRACLNLMLSDHSMIPNFFRSGVERGERLKDDLSAKWFSEMCKEFLGFFSIAIGTSLILSVITGLLMLAFGHVPSELQGFNSFGL